MKVEGKNTNEFGGRTFYQRTVQNQDLNLSIQLNKNQDFVVPWQLKKTKEEETFRK